MCVVQSQLSILSFQLVMMCCHTCMQCPGVSSVLCVIITFFSSVLKCIQKVCVLGFGDCLAVLWEHCESWHHFSCKIPYLLSPAGEPISGALGSDFTLADYIL